jgi:nucleotide-binding universal stress UspA family protein
MSRKRQGAGGPVVLATDLSPASRPAFRAALDWARRRGAGLDLVHVFVPPSPFGVPGGPGMPSWEVLETRARTSARKGLARLSAAAARTGVRVRTHLADGAPEREVARLARRRHAELVVIGTHGRTGLSRAFMGSVAERIVRSTACPVLTVRRDRMTPHTGSRQGRRETR